MVCYNLIVTHVNIIANKDAAIRAEIDANAEDFNALSLFIVFVSI